jgi:hypothetical protein
VYPEQNLPNFKSTTYRKKHQSYYVHISFLLAFTVMIDFGNKNLNLNQEDTGANNIPLDIEKQDVYKAEKKIREIKGKIESFKHEVDDRVRARTRKIIKELVLLACEEKYVSMEVLSTYLLFNYFCETDHRNGVDKEFEYFQNPNIYYPILDRVENTSLLDIRGTYYKTLQVIKKNKYR